MRAHEYNVKNAEHKVLKLKRKKDLEAARLAAVHLLSQQAELANLEPDYEPVAYECQIPHASHRVTALHGDGDTIFCKLCGQ